MTHYSSSHSHKMIWIKLKFPQSYTRIYPRKFAGFLKLLILANYFWFSNITLSSKLCHQLVLNQPTIMLHHSTESWDQGGEERTWALGLRRLWRSNKLFSATFIGHGCIYSLMRVHKRLTFSTEALSNPVPNLFYSMNKLNK